MNASASSLPDSAHLSYPDAIRLNAWAVVAVVAAFVSRLLLRDSVGLAGLPRVGVALLPLGPALLYARAIWVWMQSLDEFQRRLQVGAVCFAALVMLLVALAADLLRMAGFGAGLSFGWEGYFAFTFCVYAGALARANRRYR